MPRLLLLCAIAVVIVPVSSAAAGRGSGDGTLSVRNGEGAVRLDVRGAVIGRLGGGVLEVEEPKDGDCDALPVWGAEHERPYLKVKDIELVITVCRFSGTNMRFRLAGGPQAVRITKGRDIDVSVVGRGTFLLKGNGGADGTYSVNGEPYLSLPDESRAFELSPPPKPPASGTGNAVR